jgi:hypothetical protein
MGTCGCKWCPVNLNKLVLSHIATIGTDKPDPVLGVHTMHTRQCAIDSAKSKVLLAFDEYIKLVSGWDLIEELKEKIISAQ